MTTGTNDNADWSPDGSQLVFERSLGRGRYDVFVVDADGTRIVFTRGTGRTFAAPGDIWTIAVDGSDATRLTDTPGVDEYGLSWQST